MEAAALAFGPAPGGADLDVTIDCRNSPTSKEGEPHPVTLHADWSVTTPHDLEAERVAAALGGYSSCVELIDFTMPVLRSAIGLLTRRQRSPIRPLPKSQWAVARTDTAAGCCLGVRFETAVRAAQHTRSAAHLIKRSPRAHAWQLQPLLRASSGAWQNSTTTASSEQHLASCVSDYDGVTVLWAGGIHPEDLHTLVGFSADVGEPLPADFYFALAYGTVDRAWLRSVLAHRPDADTAVWLATLEAPHKRGTASQWGSWLGFGTSKADVISAIEANLNPVTVHEISTATGSPVSYVASRIVAWARAGCLPSAVDFAALERHGTLHETPSDIAVDSLCRDAAMALDDIDLSRFSEGRTRVGLLLSVLGTRADVLFALKHGIRSVADLDRQSITEGIK